MNLPYSEQLDIGHFGRFFDNTSECYKFFWFKAILSKISEGKTEYTYEELVDEMIAEAWYMVSEYHLNLGPRDNLEQTVKRMNEITNLKSAEKKSNILEYLKNCEDKEIKQKKNILISNVPYRLQAPLMPQFKSVDFEGKIDLRIQKINSQKMRICHIAEISLLPCFQKVQRFWMQGAEVVVTARLLWRRDLASLHLMHPGNSAPWRAIISESLWHACVLRKWNGRKNSTACGLALLCCIFPKKT